MNYNAIKNLFSTLVGGVLNKYEPTAGLPEIDPVVLSITKTYHRIAVSSTVSAPMKDYAHRLVYSYLPAIECNYHACIATHNDKVLRLNRSVESIRDETLEYIDACLLDIEHGAVFKDNLGDVFLNTLITFETQIEARAVN